MKNAQLAACCSSFSSRSVCKTIAVDGGQKGVRGGERGRPASGGLSLSITKSIATTAADQTDGRRDVRRAWWGVCVWAEGWADERVGGHISLQSLLVSPTMPPRHPTRRRHTGAGAQMDGRAGGLVCSSARWSPAFNCARRRRYCNTTNSSTL